MTLNKSLFGMLFALVASVLLVPNAEAGRLGGGKSVGKQSSTYQRKAEPAKPAQTNQAGQATPATPNAAAQPARNRWLGPIAGLAAGLGLAALASHFGFGEELANVMMIALLAMVALGVIGYFMRRKAANSLATAYAGAQPPMVRDLPNAPAVSPMAGGSAAAQPGTEEGFDEANFLTQAKRYFTRLQAVYDKADYDNLREFTTPEMFTALYAEIEGRKGAANQTDVVQLNAEFAGLEKFGGEYTASVYFSGLIREEAGGSAKEFAEVWHFTRPIQGEAGWVLAGIQQPQ